MVGVSNSYLSGFQISYLQPISRIRGVAIKASRPKALLCRVELSSGGAFLLTSPQCESTIPSASPRSSSPRSEMQHPQRPRSRGLDSESNGKNLVKPETPRERELTEEGTMRAKALALLLLGLIIVAATAVYRGAVMKGKVLVAAQASDRQGTFTPANQSQDCKSLWQAATEL